MDATCPTVQDLWLFEGCAFKTTWNKSYLVQQISNVVRSHELLQSLWPLTPRAWPLILSQLDSALLSIKKPGSAARECK